MRIPDIKCVQEIVSGRFSPHGKSIFELQSDPSFAWMPKLRLLHHDGIGGRDVEIRSGEHRIKGRPCAGKNPPDDMKKEEFKVREHVRENRQTPAEKTIELCGSMLIFTTLPTEKHSDPFLCNAYRLRWQVELMFKQLKSRLEPGRLHKHDDTSSRTCLNGKMSIAILIEKMIRMAETFSP